MVFAVSTMATVNPRCFEQIFYVSIYIYLDNVDSDGNRLQMERRTKNSRNDKIIISKRNDIPLTMTRATSLNE